ncbi:MAG: tetratricopeptide repeat protein [Paucibacter sp.]|nr:tetratricopeptide repeat protein [Roseateles sp.]
MLRPLVFAAVLAVTGAVHATDLGTLLHKQDYQAAAPLVRPLLAASTPDEAQRALIYRWHFAHDDSAAVEQLSKRFEAAVDLQAAARLALDQRDFERAQQLLARALDKAATPLDRANALRGLGQLAYQQRDFDASLHELEASLAAERTADALEALNETLIRLGRTEDAIQAAEEAVKLDPYHEQAHYQLGNGYSRRNYTQMAAQEGAKFTEAMTLVHRASDAFEQGRFEAARDDCFAALALLPDLGRAHAILARTLEAQRFKVDVHRAAYERRFAQAAMPNIEGIERYVLNWQALTPRHQKRVALSLQPWKAYIPVLAEGGATLYIKPMGMLLSEAPHMQALKDLRIEYDSRLWDDVRGAGGYHTVTGIEDVERTIFDRYNTVLHELSHQVQSVLPADLDRRIEALYQKAKSRDKPAQMAFLSRYAGGSVFEYFAEGANSADSPRRDRFDPREIVRERLVALDPELLALVTQMFAQKDVSASLPVALSGAGGQQLELGRPAQALTAYAKALRLAPDDERVQTGMLRALAIAGDRDGVNELARRAIEKHGRSGRVIAAVADARWHTGTPLPMVLAQLREARLRLQGEDGYLADLTMAQGLYNQGTGSQALLFFDAALRYQADSPEALWGRAATLAQLERWDEAFAVYEQVLRLRTGLVALRADQLRDLIRAGRLDQARTQLKEALLLDPTDPSLGALGARLALEEKNAADALTQAEAVLARAPWCDLAVIIKGRALQALGRADEAHAAVAPLRYRIKAGSGPQYLYRPEQSVWVSVHELPSVERDLLID